MQNIFVIIEGPDNVGKTTLIQNIQKHFKNHRFHYLHYSGVKRDTPTETIDHCVKLYGGMFEIMNCLSSTPGSSGIFDRSHLGEMVYGPIYRGYNGEYVLDIEDLYSLEKWWDNVFLFTLYDEPDNLVKRDDGLSFSTDLEIKKREIDNFLFAHNKSNIKNKLLVNIKNHNAEEAANVVIETIEGAET